MTVLERVASSDRSWPGPAMRSRRRRWLLSLAGVWTAATLMLWLGTPPWQAVGASLWLPTAGLAAGAAPWTALIALLALGWSVSRMPSRGDHVTPVLVLLLSTVAGAVLAGPQPSRAVLVAAPGVTLLWVGVASWRRRRAGREAHAKSPDHRALVAAITPRAEAVGLDATTLSPEDLGVQRWILDRALQAPQSWDGFDRRDQYTLKSLRYQLNWLQWALALSRANATPAFSGYLDHAQRALIERMRDPIVWSYWRRENLWGNLRASGDPIRKYNVMFSGYLAAMLGTYALSSGDRCHDEEGAMTFTNAVGSHPYNHAGIVDAIVRNFEDYPLTLYPCEPGLVFPMCNSIAFASVRMRDHLDGTSRAAEIWPRFAASLDREFTMPHGLMPFLAWTRGGVILCSSATIAHTAIVAAFLTNHDTTRAERTWALLKGLIDQGTFPPARDSTPTGSDWGTGRRSHLTDLAYGAMLAGAVGDHDAHREAMNVAGDLFNLRSVDGAAAYEGASVVGNAMLAVARGFADQGWRRMSQPTATSAPRLADCAYPDVLVARAATDGTMLDLLLEPGSPQHQVTLRLDGLTPNGNYTLSGEQTVTAGPDGTAATQIQLGQRRRLTVTPSV